MTKILFYAMYRIQHYNTNLIYTRFDAQACNEIKSLFGLVNISPVTKVLVGIF